MKFYTQLWKQFMRITFLFFSILLTIGLVSVRATNVKAQGLDTRINITVGNESLFSVIKKLELKTNLVFAYDEAYLDLNHKFIRQEKFDNQTLEVILGIVLKNTDISFKEEAGNILLFKQAYGKITGKVIDETGAPLPGATVTVVGTSVGTLTDANGNYSLTVPEGTYTIAVTFVGFKKMEFPNTVASASKAFVLNVSMTGSGLLKEVVVSYGQQRQREITGSISTVDATDLEDRPITQFAEGLQGKVAGVQITENNGAPGRGLDFRIRGAASLSSSNQPLFVIDGMPITGSINNINPAEIESFTVLKDASATALYGSRASNGVILITTKHAKPGDAKIQFDANYGMQVIPQQGRYQMQTAQQFAQFENEYYQDKLTYEPGTKPTLDPVYQNPSQYGAGTNWFNAVTRNAPVESYNLTVSSARDHSSSNVIVGYQDQQGVVINTDRQLFSMRINQDLTLSNNKIKIGFNLAPSYSIDHNNNLTTEGVGGLVNVAEEASPLFAPVNPNGSYPVLVNSPGQVNDINPYATLMLTQNYIKTTRILGNGYFNYEFLPGLTFKINLGVDKGNEYNEDFVPSVITTNGVATGSNNVYDNYSWTAETYLNYKKTLFKKNHIEALIGYSAQKFSEDADNISGSTYKTDNIPYLDQATLITAAGSNADAYSLLSTIGRLNYDYDGKYLLSVAARSDGSSRFGDDRKYGFFPSASVGWVVSDEKFMDQFKFINFFKIRASYGITGNNNIGNYTSISQIASGPNYNYTFNNVLQAGAINSTLGNADLGWERNKQLDIGFDISLLKNRISLTYDYYNKVTDGMIQARPIPTSSGFSSLDYNIGAFKFWGNEFTLNTVNLTGELKWNSSFNISFDRNLCTSLVAPGFTFRNNTVTSDYYHTQVGYPIGMFYGFINEGLYKNAQDLANSPKYGTMSDVGTTKFKDINGDGVIDPNDRTFIGNPNPDFTLGFTNTFKYKHFDLSIAMSGAYGNKILAAAKWAYLTNLDGARGLLAAVSDRWRSPQDPGSGIYPRTETGTTAAGRSVNSQWVEDGSYLEVKNINLGYTIPIKGNSVMKSIRVYTSVEQAFVFTKYSGMNPEVSLNGLDGIGQGVDEDAYPVPRTFSVGLSSTFK